MYEKITVENLTLECTRRCNMSCIHCLRGDAQDRDMDALTLYRAMKPIKSVQTLTFTGGEPSLVPKILALALHVCKQYEIQVCAFYLVTNGKEITDEFLDICRAWEIYTMECSLTYEYGLDTTARIAGTDICGLTNGTANSVYTSGIALSADPYHEPIPVKNILRLQTLSAFNTDKYNPKSRYLLKEGRAAENDLPNATVLTSERSPLDDDCDEPYFSELYVNIHGDILFNCDYSYEKQNRWAIHGNVNDEDWTEALLEHCRRHETFD